MKLTKKENGLYIGEINGMAVRIFSDYRGVNGDSCKTIQSWGFKIAGKTIEGAASKKQCVSLVEAGVEKGYFTNA